MTHVKGTLKKVLQVLRKSLILSPYILSFVIADLDTTAFVHFATSTVLNTMMVLCLGKVNELGA